MHSFERKLSPLSNGVPGKAVQRISRELFDLKARGDIFFLITLYLLPTCHPEMRRDEKVRDRFTLETNKGYSLKILGGSGGNQF